VGSFGQNKRAKTRREPAFLIRERGFWVGLIGGGGFVVRNRQEGIEG